MPTRIVFIGLEHGLTVQEEPEQVLEALVEAHGLPARLTGTPTSPPDGEPVFVNPATIAHFGDP